MQRILLGAMLRATIVMGFVFGLAQTASAQNALTPECPNPNPLCLDNNYFVTGDYVVGGVGLRGLGTIDPVTGKSLATGTISIPDGNQPNSTSVPAGADIVAAWLYWETVEATSNQVPPPHLGQNGFFKPLGLAPNGFPITGNGYPITGTILGNPNAPSNWSSGGCVGSSNGGKTLVAYRADVRPYLLQDANGITQANGSFQVMLADSGSNGGGAPLTLGASLVIIYRVLSSAKPLNAIVLYDGAIVPSNQSSQMSQTMQGFYQAAVSTPRIVKLTHIVGDGQTNKSQSVTLGGLTLPNLYPSLSSIAAFPGVYNHSWDNPTWTADNSPNINTAVPPGASMVTTSVIPGGSGSGCVDWGAVIFSTTVEESITQDGKHDGLLSVWKTSNPPGYNDAISVQNGLPNPFVALPGASSAAQDIFVEIDYLVLRGPGPGQPVLHSHLPKQIALDMVGDAFWRQNVHVHFDVGSKFNNVCKLTPALPGQLPCPAPDPYIIQGGTGGNEIPENATLCTDPICQFPATPTVGWKGGYLFIKDTATVPNSNPPVPLGNFQFGRKSAYHYVLFGHALGEPRSSWTTYGATLTDPTVAKLISISNSTVGMGSTFLVTIQTPQGTPQAILYPGYCSTNPGTPECSDANVGLITISGAIGQPALNGTYAFTVAGPPSIANGVITTTFTVAITNPSLPTGTQTYDFNNESRLAVEYLGPTTSSGHSDFPGGADSAETFGLWRVDDPSGCQPDPSVALTQGQTYCNDQVGTIQAQAGTILHEMGHTLALAHGGTFYPSPNNPNGTLLAGGQQANNLPYFESAFGLNCNPAILSSMNYLFQIRGFPDLLQPALMLPDGSQAHPIDYSGQTLRRSDGLPGLSETALNESLGIGSDLFTGNPAPHYTRWFGPPTALQTQTGQVATVHCDGTLVGQSEPPATRVNGSPLSEPQGFSGPIDWNNDLIVPDATEPVAWQDVNFNGSTSVSPDPPSPPAFNGMQGFNDWVNADLRQIGSRENALGLSSGGTGKTGAGGGGTGKTGVGGGGATSYAQSSGTGKTGVGGGGTGKTGAGGGGEQNVETACASADPPSGLTAAVVSKKVVLHWQAPGGPCQVKTYNIWRSEGGPFTLRTQLVRGNNGQTPPPTTFTDTTAQPGHTYTYFVTETDLQDATSDATNQVTIKVN